MHFWIVGERPLYVMAAIRLFGANLCHASWGMNAEAMATSIPTDRGGKAEILFGFGP
jgi:hypothetical protein